MDLAPSATRTLLVTGAYGTGKTTLAAELAELLADHEIPCAAIDLDWLGWFWLPGKREHTVNDIVVANLGALADTYSRAGVERLILAGTIRTQDELAQLAAVVGQPLRVVQLTVPLSEIARRLAADALSSRADDLELSATEPNAGADIADLTLPNETDIGELAERVADWLGWLAGT
jgi:energy-coupling factor transporter ATP-binding protein EcfA2